MNGTATTVPLREAAARMGISTDTLRKRLQRGLTPGRKVDGQWFVVPLPVPDVSDPVQDTGSPGLDQTGPVPDSPATELPALPGRAAEMAEYTERLLAPWRAVVQAQAEEIGALKAQLAAQTPSAPPAGGQAGRSWGGWWRWLWGLA